MDRYYQLRKQVHNIQFYFAKLTRPVHLCNIANFFESCKNIQTFNEKTGVKFEKVLSQLYVQLVFKAPLCITLTISDQNHYLNREW